MKKLYPIQEESKRLLMAAISKHGAALAGGETGVGKTLVAAEIAADITNPVLVICPKAVCPMWKQELAERKVKPLGVINPELLRRGNSAFGKWTRGNWEFTLPNDTFIIWDECHRAKSPSSQNGRMLLAAKPFHVLAMSATAAENPAEMRALGFLLGLHQLGNWWVWARERGCYVNHFGKLEFNNDPKVLEALHKEIYPERGHRLRISDLAEHFTETQIITTPLDFGDKVQKLYAEMEKELANLAEIMATDSTHPAARALTVTLRARQSVELCKVPLMLEMIEDLVAEGRSVAVFVNFNATVDALCERLASTCGLPALVRGGQSEDIRSKQVTAFQNNKAIVILCNIQAGGLGLSLHDLHGGHPRTAIISPSWSAFDVIQALGRVHRAGGQSATQQHILFAAGTIEEQVERVVRSKIRNISLLNDGKRVDGLTRF